MNGYDFDYKSQGTLSGLLHAAGVTNLVKPNGRTACTVEAIEREIFDDGGYKYPLLVLNEFGEPEQIVREKDGRRIVLVSAFHRGYFFVEVEIDGVASNRGIADTERILGIASTAGFRPRAHRSKSSSRVPRLRS